LDFDCHWQYSARLSLSALQLPKRKLVIADTSATIATTDRVVAVRDTHRGVVIQGMIIPDR
jgi:hypothetical protein